MSARLIKIPESMKETYDLVDGKLVKKVRSKKASKAKASLSRMIKLFLLITALSGAGIAINQSSPSGEESLDKACSGLVELGNYQDYVRLKCADR